MATKRKTLEETKREYRSLGFEEAQEILVKEWRRRAWLIVGKTGSMKQLMQDPIVSAFWKVIREGDKEAARLNNEYKELMIPRLHGK